MSRAILEVRGAKARPAEQKPVFYLLVGLGYKTLLMDTDRGLHARYGPATLGCAALGARTATAVTGTCPVIYHPDTKELEGFGRLSEPKPDHGSVARPVTVYGAGYGRRDVLSKLSSHHVGDGNWHFFAMSNRGKLFVDSDNELADNVSSPGILGAAGLFAGTVRYVDSGVPVKVRHVDRGADLPAELEAIGDFLEPPEKLDTKAKRGRFRIAAVGFT